MISIDFQCTSNHRFEGFFKDRATYEVQFENKLILCPFCENSDIKRIYSGCSIQSKSSQQSTLEKQYPNLLQAIQLVNQYIKDNFENVGKNLADSARAMHYGLDEARNIYGESSPAEISELLDEGIELFPILDINKINN